MSQPKAGLGILPSPTNFPRTSKSDVGPSLNVIQSLSCRCGRSVFANGPDVGVCFLQLFRRWNKLWPVSQGSLALLPTKAQAIACQQSSGIPTARAFAEPSFLHYLDLTKLRYTRSRGAHGKTTSSMGLVRITILAQFLRPSREFTKGLKRGAPGRRSLAPGYFLPASIKASTNGYGSVHSGDHANCFCRFPRAEANSQYARVGWTTRIFLQAVIY